MKTKLKLIVLLALIISGVLNETTPKLADESKTILVNKCCGEDEIFHESECVKASTKDVTDTLKPLFTDYKGNQNNKVIAKFTIGFPKCNTTQRWPLLQYPNSVDKLVLMDDGKLRHYTFEGKDQTKTAEYDYLDENEEQKEPFYHDYIQGHYCYERATSTNSTYKKFLYAIVCHPGQQAMWTDTDFLLRKIINPIFHGISLIILLLIAVVYFILPTLRDLVGNIVTTITVCLMISQAANIAKIFTEFSNHVSFFLVDTIMYTFMMGAFFWLNAFGYYIWKTFRSRNVFLRVTDGRKYCYYSAYVWGVTGLMTGLAIFAHFFLDSEEYKKKNMIEEQETIGWLGIAMFFSPIAVSIIIDIFFYVTTVKLINRRNVYGRIQHKLKANFVMYSLMLLVMFIAWIFLILSWLNFDGLLYAHIIVNAIQSPLLLYICIHRQTHVKYLLKKSCCYNEPTANCEWGDEMNYMNGDY